MNKPKPTQAGENRQATVIVPTRAQSLMTGVIMAKLFASGVCQLTYEDHNTEEANLTFAQVAQGRNNFFSLVSGVQSYRPDNLHS